MNTSSTSFTAFQEEVLDQSEFFDAQPLHLSGQSSDPLDAFDFMLEEDDSSEIDMGPMALDSFSLTGMDMIQEEEEEDGTTTFVDIVLSWFRGVIRIIDVWLLLAATDSSTRSSLRQPLLAAVTNYCQLLRMEVIVITIRKLWITRDKSNTATIRTTYGLLSWSFKEKMIDIDIYFQLLIHHTITEPWLVVN